MKPGWLLLAAPTLLLAQQALARAEDPPGCPPGEWFCDDSSGEPEPALPPEGMPEYAPPEDADGAPQDDGDREVEPSDDEEEFDVRRPAPPHSGWSEGSGGRDASPWGLAMRVQGVLMEGRRQGEHASLGGVGVSGRYALNHVVTLDLGLDTIVGTDYNGYDRSELSLSVSSLFYLNHHPVVRTYVLVGLNTSTAQVDVNGDDQTWGYFGGQTGLGLDIALDRRVALNFDIIGFMRGRTDSRAEREPEFTDGLGRVTNTAGGGLLRGGVILHF
jgi:Outer membrane protein beta-barrel domain